MKGCIDLQYESIIRYNTECFRDGYQMRYSSIGSQNHVSCKGYWEFNQPLYSVMRNDLLDQTNECGGFTQPNIWNICAFCSRWCSCWSRGKERKCRTSPSPHTSSQRMETTRRSARHARSSSYLSWRWRSRLSRNHLTTEWVTNAHNSVKRWWTVTITPGVTYIIYSSAHSKQSMFSRPDKLWCVGVCVLVF